MVEFDRSRMPYLAVIGIVASFGLLLIGFVLAMRGVAANQRASELISHTYTVKDIASGLGINLERSEAARRGYLLDRRAYRLAAFDDSSNRLMPAFDQLESLTLDNPQQQQLLLQLRPLLRREFSDLQWSVRLARQGRLDAARRSFESQADQATLLRIRALIAAIQKNEDFLLAERLAAERDAQSRLRFLLSLIGLLIVASAVGTVYLLSRNARALAASRDRLRHLNENLEGEVEVRTAELKRANDEIQRFAYIVSHDLRSPLVNILGFTSELENTNRILAGLIERAQAEAPQLLTDDVKFAQEDLEESISFIRASTQKMDRLINAILKLSREGRRTLTPELLKMTPLIHDIAATLAQPMEDAGASLQVEGDLPDIMSDRLAMEQILANLIENAVKYGRPGQSNRIVVRGEKRGERVIYEVQDEGRGIDPKDAERIFDLFRRAGAQDVTGEGIGLAQVRSLVHRLGGTIVVDSKLGEGSLFRLSLPATYEDHGASSE